MNNLEKISDDDRIVNYVCFCKKNFKVGSPILYGLPCCHMFHEKCFNKYILENQLKTNDKKNLLDCPICNEKIETVLNENKINSKDKYIQYKNDILSVKLDNSAEINYVTLPISIVKLTSMVNKTILIENQKQFINTLEYILKGMNIKINIIDNTKRNPFNIVNNSLEWKSKKDNNEKVVIISNHSHYLDSFILHYIFRCGFVSSDFINATDLGRLIASKCKLLIFKRGVDTNMVEKIKEYLNEMKKIVVYPEGAMANNNTLLRFRTGAFYTGAAICPVVIKYKNFVYDDDIKLTLLKLITQDEISVDVYINDFEYPPFDNQKIEKIRDKMAKIGNLKKSRVSNRNVKE